jgi:hypothetical protein
VAGNPTTIVAATPRQLDATRAGSVSSVRERAAALAGAVR